MKIFDKENGGQGSKGLLSPALSSDTGGEGEGVWLAQGIKLSISPVSSDI